MAKKKNSIVQKKNKYRNLELSFRGCQYISVLAPFFIIGIVNYNDYFVEYNGTRMSIAFVLAMIIMGIAVWGITKKKLETSLVTFLIGWYAVAFIFWLLGNIILDISTIMFIGGFGILSAIGFNKAEKWSKGKKERVINSMKSAEDKQDEEQYMKEKNENE